MARKTVGLYEDIEIHGKKKEKTVKARIDTGATKSSIDMTLVAELGLGPVINTRIVKSTHGTMLRPVIKVDLTIAGDRITAEFTVADRGHMKYRVLIGQNVLKTEKFMIDPLK